MENMLSNKTVSLTELRNPVKVLAYAGDSPVTILNRNKVVGYFVPKSAVGQVPFEMASIEDVKKILETPEENQGILDNLSKR